MEKSTDHAEMTVGYLLASPLFNGLETLAGTGLSSKKDQPFDIPIG